MYVLSSTMVNLQILMILYRRVDMLAGMVDLVMKWYFITLFFYLVMWQIRLKGTINWVLTSAKELSYIATSHLLQGSVLTLFPKHLCCDHCTKVCGCGDEPKSHTAFAIWSTTHSRVLLTRRSWDQVCILWTACTTKGADTGFLSGAKCSNTPSWLHSYGHWIGVDLSLLRHRVYSWQLSVHFYGWRT